MKDFEMALEKMLVISAIAAACFGLSVPTVLADDTGFASMHAWTKVGRKTCYADHTHFGSSNGHKTKKKAMAAAIRDWREFTAGEYGTDWATFKIATAKNSSCSQGASGWSCSVDARPCYRKQRR